MTSSPGFGSHAATGRKPTAAGHSHSNSFADISGRIGPSCRSDKQSTRDNGEK